MHQVLVNRLGGLSLPRKIVVRLTDRPHMTLDVYRGRKTTMQQLHDFIEQVLTMCCVQEWQSLLSYFLSYFPLMVSDAISCLLCNLNTLWYIIMILHCYVEQVLMMCHVQEWQLSLPYFLSYFLLMISDAISCPLCNLNTLWYIVLTFHSYVEKVLTICCIQEWQLLLAYFLSYFPLIV